jgi:hypothetical protein
VDAFFSWFYTLPWWQETALFGAFLCVCGVILYFCLTRMLEPLWD